MGTISRGRMGVAVVTAVAAAMLARLMTCPYPLRISCLSLYRRAMRAGVVVAATDVVAERVALEYLSFYDVSNNSLSCCLKYRSYGIDLVRHQSIVWHER